MNLWSQVFLIDGGERLGKSFTNFRNIYYDSDYMGYTYTIKAGAEETILSKIEDVAMTLKAQDYIDLPDKIERIHEIEMSAADRDRYAEFEKHQVLSLIDGEDDGITAVNAAVLSNKLLQFTSGALYLDDEGNYQEIHSTKLDYLEEIVEEANGKPILLGYFYKHEIERIKARFKDDLVVLDDNPETLARWNRGEIKILAANPASAGHGLNAQKGGNILVWYSYPNWDLELYEQFTQRLVRRGQKESTVIIHHLITPNTNDMRVLESLQAKDRQQRRLFDALSARVREVLETV